MYFTRYIYCTIKLLLVIITTLFNVLLCIFSHMNIHWLKETNLQGPDVSEFFNQFNNNEINQSN